MKTVKLLSGILIAAALIFAAAWAWHHTKPKPIDVTRKAVVYTEDDPASAFHTQIRISGTLQTPLFRPHKFEGSVRIDAFEFTETYWTSLAISTKRNGIYMGGLMYNQLDSHRFLTAGSAMIWFDENFERINIWTRPSWGKCEGPEPAMFIATGETYEQAIANQKAMKEQFNDDVWFVPREFP